MRITRTYIKQSDNGIASHTYEHVVADHVLKTLLEHGYQQLLDYELSAHTYDGIIVLRFDTYSRKTLRVFTEALKSCRVTPSKVAVAITQIACEFQRNENLNRKTLVSLVRKIHADNWISSQEYAHTLPVQTKDARELVTSIGGYTKKSTKDFQQYEFTYTIKDCPYELKSLAVYVLQIIGLNQIGLLTNSIKTCYDSGDHWAEYQELVGYAHTLTVPSDQPLSQEELDQYIQDTLSTMSSKKSMQKIVRYVRRDRLETFPYFSFESLFAKAYQVTGTQGFKQTTTLKNVQTILDNLEVTAQRLS